MTGGADAVRRAVEGADVVAFPGGGSGDDLNRELADKDRNDLGNAERLLARFGQDILFVREVGWHVWDGKCFRREGAEAVVRQRAHETVKSILEEVDAAKKSGPRAWEHDGETHQEPVGDFNKRLEDLFGWAKSSGNKSKIDGMVSEAVPYVSVGTDVLDADLYVINLANGTMRLEGACEALRDHAREDRLAKVMPVEFDADAECRKFMEFLHRVQPDAEVREFLQRWIGYSLTGSIGEQKLVFNLGEGSNGKGVFTELMARIMGPYAASLPFTSLTRDDRARGAEATPDLARLPGVRFVRVSEPEKNVRFAEAKLKFMTGGEPIPARHLNQGFFEFMPHFKLHLSGNHRPVIQGQDHGIWRRILLVPWAVIIPDEEQDLNLPAKLWAERSGVLNWMLDGARMWLESGLNIPDKVRAATNEYKTDSDPLGRFIADCVEHAPNEHVSGAAMYDAYKRWCGANAERVWSLTAFGRALPESGLEKERVGGIVRYLHVRLVNIPDGAAADEPPPASPEDFE